MPLISDGVVGTLWSTGARKFVTSAVAAIGVLAGTITGVHSAWPIVDEWVPTSHGYARELHKDVVRIAEEYSNKNAAILRDVQIEQAEGKQEAVSSELFKWQIELNKTADENVKPLIQEQIRRLNTTKDRLDAQIRTLNAVKQKQ